MAGIPRRLPDTIVKLMAETNLRLTPETGKYGILTIIGLIAMFIGWSSG